MLQRKSLHVTNLLVLLEIAFHVKPRLLAKRKHNTFIKFF